MNDRFQMRFQNHPAWREIGRTWVRGSAFCDNSLLGSEELCRSLDKAAGDPDAFFETVRRLNGFFAAVHVHGTRLFAAVDLVRSIPLFYGVRDGRCFVSDDARWVRDKVGDKERNPETEREFLLVSYVTGSDTLYPNVRQVQAGEMIIATAAGHSVDIQRRFHFRHVHHDYWDASEQVLLDRLDAATTGSFTRLIEYADGRAIALSLSGGYDSRLMALTLRRLKYDNVICFTFGRPGNAESEISGRVAEKLGMRWKFVPYSNEYMRRWFDSEARQRHYRMADGLCSLPQIIHWPAIQELTDSKALPDDCLIVPGVAADVPAGSYSVYHPELYENERVDIDEVVSHTIACHYSLWPLTRADRQICLRRVRDNILWPREYLDSADMFEDWFTREKLAKLIANSIRTYEFCHRDWWLPYFDKTFIDFWLRVRPRYRIGQGIYAKYIERTSELMLGFHIPSKKSDPGVLQNTRLGNRLKKTFLRPLYAELRRRGLGPCVRNAYETDPLACYGFMSAEDYSRHLRTASNVRSYLARFYLEEGADRSPYQGSNDQMCSPA